MDTDEIKALILQGLPDAEVKVAGKNDHFSATVLSAHGWGRKSTHWR